MRELPDIQIRRFTEDDILGALELWSSVEGLGLSDADSPERITQFLDRNQGFSAVACAPDIRIVGAVLCGHNGRTGSMYHLAVANSSRGKGIAQALVAFCFQRLGEAGIARCYIFTYDDNERGNRFWLRNGWSAATGWGVLHKRVSE